MSSEQQSSNERHDALSGARRAGWKWAVIEVFWLLLIFFLFAGTPPPDVGEAHYLAKAKHYWNPSWCAGDLFLESADAHLTFNWALGWLTMFLSLPVTAWVGRGVTWLLLAWSWQRLSWSLIPVRFASLLSAGLMLWLARGFHMAGEWIVGGVEAKGIAFGFVFLAVGSLVKGQWRAASLLAGAATTFHVLLGGWTLVCLAFAWLVSPRERLPLVRLWPALVGAVLVALPGLVPAILLTRGIDPAVVAEANRIYVFERLPHHLVFHRFEHFYMARHVLLLSVWGLLAWKLRSGASVRRLNWFVVGAIGLAVIGILLDQSLLNHRDAAAAALRYYWFRLNDAMLPVATALLLVFGLRKLYAAKPVLGSWLLIAAILTAGGNLADVCYRRAQLRVPGSFRQPRPWLSDPSSGWWTQLVRRADDSVPSGPEGLGGGPAEGSKPIPPLQLFEYWRDACAWIEQNTPTDAKFVTPRHQQTFKWYAQRAEVATWKDVPQDAAALVEWKRVRSELYPRATARFDLAAHPPERLAELAHRYRADYVVLDRQRAGRGLPWERVYPAYDEENPAYEVYRVPPVRVR